MPVNPSPNFLQQFGMQAPQVPQGNNLPGIAGPMPVAQPLLPSWMRTGFEGGLDASMGALGVGPQTKMNQVGQMGAAALPFMGGIMKLLGLGGEAAAPMARFAEGGDLFTPPKTPINPMTRFNPGGDLEATGKKAITDVSGRVLGYEPPPDISWDAHVGSSRNKNPPVKPQGYAPPVDQLEELMKRFKK